MHDVTSLANALTHGSVEERRAAAEALARLGTDARPAALPMVQALDQEDDSLRDWLVAALEELGPPPAGDVPALAALVARPRLDSAYWAATLLGRLESAAAPAVPQLAAALGEHSEQAVRERAAWALGKIGPTALAAHGALEKAVGDGNVRLARVASQALSQIGG